MKELFKKLLEQGAISKGDDIELYLNIDQQGIATNGLYGFQARVSMRSLSMVSITLTTGIFTLRF